VGLLTGPVGALVTGGLGAMIGNYMDKEESKDTYMALEKIGESLSDGDTAVLLLATEQDESALAEELKDFQVSITRMDTFNHTMQRMWVNFAKTGDPSLTAEESPTGKAIKWELYNSDTKPVMIFDEFNIHQSTEGDYGIVDWERTYPLTKYYIF